MKLYFTCPKTQTTFSTDNYILDQGYRVVETKEGERSLEGTVHLGSDCPFCGERHQYDVKDIICPFSGGEHGK